MNYNIDISLREYVFTIINVHLIFLRLAPSHLQCFLEDPPIKKFFCRFSKGFLSFNLPLKIYINIIILIHKRGL